MKRKFLLLMLLMLGGLWANAQVPPDTIQIKGLIIIKGKNEKGRNSYKFYNDTAYTSHKLKKNLQTRWLVVDVGFNNYLDRSDYIGASYLAYYASPNNGYLGGSNAPIMEKGAYDYTSIGLNTLAPRQASEPLTPSEFKLITGKSVNINIWLFMQRLNIAKHKFNLLYALGLEMNNYRYARSITYEPGYPTKIVRDSVEFSKNKLFASYLTVPVMLNFNSNPYHPGRSFELSVGVTGGYLMKSRTKQISAERGKVRRVDEFNLNKWRFGIATEVGYGPVKLYGNFALTPLHDYGLEQYPFSIGFRFNGF